MGGIFGDPVGEVAAELREAAVQLGAVGEQSGGEGGRAEEIVAGSEVEVEEVAEIGREVGEWILLHSQLYQPPPPPHCGGNGSGMNHHGRASDRI